MGAIDVLVVEDSPEIRDLVRFSLGLDPAFSVVGEAGDPIEALPLVSEHQPDVVLLDLAMPRMGGLEAIDHVRRACPASAIVIYSSLLERHQGDRARELGADAYLEKGAPIDTMRKTLRNAAEIRAADRRDSDDAQRRLETIVDSASDAIVAWSLDGTITDWNPGAERLYGFTAAEAVGGTIDLFTPPERRASARARQRRVLTTGVVERIEAPRLTKSGKEIMVAITASPMRNERNEIIGATGISRDISEKRRHERDLELSERRFRALSESAPVGILALDQEDGLTFANSEFQRIAGYSAEQMAGLGWLGLIHPADRERIAADLSSGQDELNLEFRLQRADGAVRTVAMRSRSSDGLAGEFAGRLASVFDVTGEREAAAELVRSRAMIEQQNEELERSNAELEQFAYAASHDLQEPLRVIGGFVELLRDRYEGQLDDDADRFIAATISGVGRMGQLIDDLLAYSRVGRAEIARADIDTRATVNAVLERLAEPVATSGIEVELGALPVISGDPGMLDQIFQNLISNAVKFTTGDAPRIEISGSEDCSGWRFVVADNGEPIESRHREQIFETFQRLHGRSVPGTGIGLAICQRIAERHGGRIWVEPAADGGNAFVFTISH